MTAALLLLDLQNEMVDPQGKVGAHGLARIVEERGVLANARRCLDAARGAGMAVVHVRLGFRPDYADCLSVAARIGGLKANRAAIVGEFGTEFHPDVAPADDELVITKQCVNPFFNTGLMTWLMQKGIKQLYMGGVATHLVVESTARFADDAGFAPVVIEDICAAPNAALHDHFITMIAPAVGTVSTTEAFVQAAQGG
ncbi:isochorismatase family cysteine hydrolase [Sphingobium chungbukense]|uniref:isochorismatase family cysteine hydrolase n=1 Tax=Sphingobium chungbukense TaxID=56193 RepID=UPI00069C0BC4|nr:isochorismatase family cysteine hydrolase [Sphingobium chungbukense]